MKNKTDSPVLTPLDLSRRWKLAIGTLANMRCARVGPRAFKIGRSVRYRLVDVLAHEAKAGR